MCHWEEYTARKGEVSGIGRREGGREGKGWVDLTKNMLSPSLMKTRSTCLDQSPFRTYLQVSQDACRLFNYFYESKPVLSLRPSFLALLELFPARRCFIQPVFLCVDLFH